MSGGCHRDLVQCGVGKRPCSYPSYLDFARITAGGKLGRWETKSAQIGDDQPERCGKGDVE